VYEAAQTLPPDSPKLDDPGVGTDASDVVHDSTIVLPGGIPSNSMFIARLKEFASMFVVYAFSGTPSNVETADEDRVASLIAWAEKSAGSEESVKNVRVADSALSRLDVMTIIGPSGIHGRYELMPEFKPGQLIDVGSLPEPRRTSMKQKIEKLREAYKNVKVGSDGRVIKP